MKWKQTSSNRFYWGEIVVVKVYTTPFCPYCEMVKALLNHHGIAFREVDVRSDQKAAKEMVSKSGQDGVPVVEIDDKIIVGFDSEKILEALGL